MIIIFGAGIRGKRYLKILRELDIEVNFFCDNNKTLWGKEMEGIPVISLDDLRNKYIDNEILIANKNNGAEIKRQLEALGVNHILTLEEVIFLYKRLSYLAVNNSKEGRCTSDNPILSIVVLGNSEIVEETIGSIYAQKVDITYEIVQWKGPQTQVKGEKILCIRNGSMLQANAIQELLDVQRDRGGLVGSKSVRSDGRINQAGYIVASRDKIVGYGYGERATKPEYEYVRVCDAVSADGMLFDAKYWEVASEKIQLNSDLLNASIMFSMWMKDKHKSVVLQPFSLIVDEKTHKKEYQIYDESLRKICWKYVDICRCQDETLFWQANSEHVYTHVLMVDDGIARFDMNAGNRSTYDYIQRLLELNVWMLYLVNDFFYEYKYVKLFQKKGVFVVYGEEWNNECESMLASILPKITYAFLNRPNIAERYTEIIRRYSDAMIVHYGHDLHYLRLMREYRVTGAEKYLVESEKYKELEHKLADTVDITGYPSIVEVKEMQEAHPGKEIQFFPLNSFENTALLRENRQRNGLLFVGGFAHSPNEDAAIWLIKEILPELREYGILDKVYLVGSNPTSRIIELESEDVIVTGYVTDEQLEVYYEECAIAIIPLRYGAGMKGKVLEALYKGMPVVTTDIGAEGLVSYENVISIGNSVDEIVKRICELYKDPVALWEKGVRGREYVLKYFGKERMLEMLRRQLETAIEKCDKGKG